MHWSGFGMYAGADLEVDGERRPISPVLVGPPMTRISLLDGMVFFLATEEQVNAGAVGNGERWKGVRQSRLMLV